MVRTGRKPGYFVRIWGPPGKIALASTSYFLWVFAFDLDGNLGEGSGQGIDQAIDRFSAAGAGLDRGDGCTFSRGGWLQAEQRGAGGKEIAETVEELGTSRVVVGNGGGCNNLVLALTLVSS